MAIRERLLNRALYRDTGCIEYLGANTTGYGCMRVDGKTKLVHRLAWEVWRGPIPDGLNVLHHCDNPPCFNTAHLYLGTQSDNTRDRHARKPETTARGEQLRRKLKEADVLRMRSLYATGEFSTRQLQSAHFQWVSARTVASVVSRETWMHI